jgi:hypothetical protein
MPAIASRPPGVANGLLAHPDDVAVVELGEANDPCCFKAEGMAGE